MHQRFMGIHTSINIRTQSKILHMQTQTHEKEKCLKVSLTGGIPFVKTINMLCSLCPKTDRQIKMHTHTRTNKHIYA